MQAAAALMRFGPETAPIEWLPDEVLALMFHILDPKTLMMAIPAVSVWGARGRGDAQSSVGECAQCG